MNYIEIKILLSGSQIIRELLVYELSELGYESFQDFNDGISAYIPENEFLNSHLKKIISICKSDLISTEKIIHKSQNWNKEWEMNFHPIKVNDDCIIRTSFHKTPKTKYDVIINPEMTFGTGHHETTLLIAQQLFKENLECKNVLDIGTGTGILAILCEFLLSKSVLAVDIDKTAVENAIRNVELNGCKNINVQKGDSSSIQNQTFHYILANINKNVLINDMHIYSKSLKSGGKLLLSGFFNLDVNEILNKGNEYGLKFVDSIELNKWTLLILKK